MATHDETLTTVRTEVDNARAYLAQGTPSAVEGPLGRIVAAVEAMGPSYVPQDIAAECLAALAPLDVPGEPNTLWALVLKAMRRISELEIKPSESSMVQRIEALEGALRSIGVKARLLGKYRPYMDPAAQASRWIVDVIDGVLDGPPDPERDREARRETEAAEADDARLDAIEGENNYREIIDR